MAGIGGSVEDQISKSLRLNEKTKKEQVQALIDYFRSIMQGENKTAPLALNALMEMMYKKYEDDEDALMAKYFLNNEGEIIAFFNKNFQRFNYYDFKHVLMKLKGETVFEEFKIPVNNEYNFNQVEPFDTSEYQEVLENDQLYLQKQQERTDQKNAEEIKTEKDQDNTQYAQKLEELKKQIKDNIDKGMLSKEQLENRLKYAEESCIASLQLEYNTRAIKDLTDIFYGDVLDKTNKKVSEIFNRLKMSQQMRERFYSLLSKKLV